MCGSQVSTVARYADTVTEISGGDLEVKFFEPGALVPALEVYDAAANGSVDAGRSVSGFRGAKILP